MDYLTLLTFVFLQCPFRCGGAETELCYFRHGDSNANKCGQVKSTGPCCTDQPSNIMVTVYMKDGCNSVTACQPGGACCSKSNVIPVNEEHKMELIKHFMKTNCFHDVTPSYVVSSMPNSIGLDLVVVSYSCPDTPTTQSTASKMNTKQPSPMEASTKDRSQATSTDDEEGSDQNVILSTSISCTFVAVIAIVIALLLVYLRRRKLDTQDARSANVLPPTYEHLRRQVADAEYSQIAGGTAPSQAVEVGSEITQPCQGRMYVNVVDTLYEQLSTERGYTTNSEINMVNIKANNVK